MQGGSGQDKCRPGGLVRSWGRAVNSHRPRRRGQTADTSEARNVPKDEEEGGGHLSAVHGLGCPGVINQTQLIWDLTFIPLIRMVSMLSNHLF